MFKYLRRNFARSSITTPASSDTVVGDDVVVVVSTTSEITESGAENGHATTTLSSAQNTLHHANTTTDTSTHKFGTGKNEPTLLHASTFPLDQHEANVLGIDAAALGGPIAHDGRMHRRKRPGRFADACGLTKHGCPRLCAYGICVTLLAVFAFLLAFFLWARLPELGTFNVEMPPGSPYQQVGNGFVLNFFLLLQVTNPNFLGAQFTSIKAKAYLPVMPNLLLANGTADDVDVSARNTTTIRFPFTLRYSQADDPKSLILADLADRCAIRGNHPPRPIVITYTVEALWKVGAIQVQFPEFKSTANFDCPVKADDNTTLLTNVPMESINQARIIAP